MSLSPPRTRVLMVFAATVVHDARMNSPRGEGPVKLSDGDRIPRPDRLPRIVLLVVVLALAGAGAFSTWALRDTRIALDWPRDSGQQEASTLDSPTTVSANDVSTTGSADGLYAGITRSQAKRQGAVDAAVEREGKGGISEKDASSLITELLNAKATLTRTECVVLPSRTAVIVGTPKGLKLKPFWLVTFPVAHARIWESRAEGLAACTRDPQNVAIFADSFPH